MKTIAYNCGKCGKIIIAEPSIKTETGEHYIDFYCPDCCREQPLNKLIVKKVDMVYDVEEAMEENVKMGRATKQWDIDRQCWTYGLTEKGKKYVEDKLLRGA